MWPFTSRRQVAERKEPGFRAASPENPETDLADPAGWLSEAFGGGASLAGPLVSETSAMKSTTIYRAVALKAAVIAALPLMVYERTAGGRVVAAGHRLYRLLHDEPNSLMSAFIWKELIVANLMLAGNHYSIIEYDGAARVVGLTPVMPQQASVARVNGRNRYTFTFSDGRITLDQADVLHVPGLGFDGVKGLSPIAYAGKQAIGNSLAMNDSIGNLHRNAMRPGGWMAVPAGIKAPGLARLRAALDQMNGGVGNTGKTLLVDHGSEWNPMQMSFADAQTLEMLKLSVEDLGRLMGVPPIMLGVTGATSNWGTGVEQQTTGFKVFNLEGELSRIEGELNRKLFGYPYYCEFNREALNAMDAKTRSALYASAIQNAGMTPNEIRRLQNLPDVEGGNELFIQSGTVPLSLAGKVPVVKPPKKSGDDDADEAKEEKADA